MRSESLIKLFCLLPCLAWIIYHYFNLPYPSDIGDGLSHYFISEAALVDPSFFLHHWGKPAFILASTLFAQLGFHGIFVFNLFVFFFTTWIGWKILAKLRVPLILHLPFPFLLLLTDDYFITLVSGLTEPFFSLILLICIYFYILKKHSIFALFIGILPFCRSEGQLLIPIALVILVYLREWKSIPFMLVPFLLYALIGIPVKGEFWWYFTQSPYHLDNNIYGQGEWNHFFVFYHKYLGTHGLVLLLLGLVPTIYSLFRKNACRFDFALLTLFFAPMIGIVLVHGVLWTYGLNGSMGLTRTATQGLPALLLGSLFLCTPLFINIPSISKKFSLMTCSILFLFLLLSKNRPIDSNLKEEQNAVKDASEFVKNQAQRSKTKCLFHHPLFAYYLGINLVIPKGPIIFYSHQGTMNDLKKSFKFGDLVFWDGHFGPVEMRLPYDSLRLDPEFQLVYSRSFIGSNVRNECAVFQYVPADFKINNFRGNLETPLFDTLVEGTSNEFINLKKFKASQKPYRFYLELSGSPEQELILSTPDGHYYQTINLSKEPNKRHFKFDGSEEINIYIWNPNKTKISKAKVKLVLYEETVYPLYRKN